MKGGAATGKDLRHLESVSIHSRLYHIYPHNRIMSCGLGHLAARWQRDKAGVWTDDIGYPPCHHPCRQGSEAPNSVSVYGYY